MIRRTAPKTVGSFSFMIFLTSRPLISVGGDFFYMLGDVMKKILFVIGLMICNVSAYGATCNAGYGIVESGGACILLKNFDHAVMSNVFTERHTAGIAPDYLSPLNICTYPSANNTSDDCRNAQDCCRTSAGYSYGAPFKKIYGVRIGFGDKDSIFYNWQLNGGTSWGVNLLEVYAYTNSTEKAALYVGVPATGDDGTTVSGPAYATAANGNIEQPTRTNGYYLQWVPSQVNYVNASKISFYIGYVSPTTSYFNTAHSAVFGVWVATESNLQTWERVAIFRPDTHNVPYRKYTIIVSDIQECAAGTYNPNETILTPTAQNCTTCPTAYPNSDPRATAITECFSNTKSRAWNGSQNACSVANATVTCNSCSNNDCDYVAYSDSAGTGDGTIKSGCSTNNDNCNQTVKTFSCNKNFFANGSVCTSCPSAHPYTVSSGSTAKTQCYIDCERACTQTCNKTNATCTFGSGKTTGKHYYNSTCNAASSTCEVTGFTCNSGYGQNYANNCIALCVAGFETLRTSTGVSVPLYASAATSPAIHIKAANGTMCYGNLVSGSTNGALNIKHNGTTYHTVQ